jgi:nucleotidyltransferase/DNA polymerase involved in DNA repair
VFLGKVASDIQKPDDLVVITPDNPPDVLLPLRLTEIYGIGPRMEMRLNRAGITNVADLWHASLTTLRRVLGHQRLAVPSNAARRRYPTTNLAVYPQSRPSTRT